MPARIRAITLDLDDTLWPFAPVAQRIETALGAWLAEHAPGNATRIDRAAMESDLAALHRERPELIHDVAATRRELLRRMLGTVGDDPALVEAAAAVVFEARQQVDLYPEVAAALDRLAVRRPLIAVTNGNADLELTGVSRWLTNVVSPVEVGVGKPDARIFHFACELLELAPAEVLHVGDNLELDVHGALDAGLQAAWVHRDLEGEPRSGALRYRDLTELADALDALDAAET
jgi:HAD superfamily hydrolase (TIGR01509 family)